MACKFANTEENVDSGSTIPRVLFCQQCNKTRSKFKFQLHSSPCAGVITISGGIPVAQSWKYIFLESRVPSRGRHRQGFSNARLPFPFPLVDCCNPFFFVGWKSLTYNNLSFQLISGMLCWRFMYHETVDFQDSANDNCVHHLRRLSLRSFFKDWLDLMRFKTHKNIT